MCKYNIVYIYKSYGLAFPSRRTERKEVTVRFKSAVTFGKFLASPICYEQMLFPLLHGCSLMGRTCYREEFRSCQSREDIGKGICLLR